MTANAKRTRDHNNFINIILNKIALARNFHQRIALSITSKSVLNHIVLKFYLRRRYSKLYLYTRVQGNFATVLERHSFIRDINKLTNIDIESTKGHLSGFILDTTEDESKLTEFLKLVSVLSHPNEFYKKINLTSVSYINYPETSKIPIHINITNNILNNLSNSEIIRVLTQEITKK